MVALLQRVRHASVQVGAATVASIGPGMLILLGVHEADTEEEVAWLARKCTHLRIFPDADGRMNRSIRETGGEALVVSQFTLYGDVARGNRPSFDRAAGPGKAETLYGLFLERLDELLVPPVRSGIFGAMMDVELTNDGPVTLWIERLHAES
jgi:D-tyrosyl-tRNA(Tyr) deacylase